MCFLTSWTIMAIISFGFPYAFSGYNGWKIIFHAFPWTPLCQGFEALSVLSDRRGLVALNGTLVIQSCVYTLLAIYFNACIPDNDGRAALPWYLLDYRRIYPMVRHFSLETNWTTDHKNTPDMQEVIARKVRKTLACKEYLDEADECIIAQEAEMRSHFEEYLRDPSHVLKSEYAIQMHGLKKEYRNNHPFPGLESKKTEALHGNWFGVKKGEVSLKLNSPHAVLTQSHIHIAGECFSLLGPNSAGKTTTIKCLLGLAEPTEGMHATKSYVCRSKASTIIKIEHYIVGQAILSGFNICIPQEYRSAQSNIGYCPQDNKCLIDLLTLTEHHELICAIKGCTPTIDHIQTLEHITVRTRVKPVSRYE